MFIDIVPKKIDAKCVIQIMSIYVLIGFEIKLLALLVIKKSEIKF